MADKYPCNLYRLNQSHPNYKLGSSYMNFLTKYIQEEDSNGYSFKKQDLRSQNKPKQFKGYRCLLFHKVSDNVPVWRDFLKPICDPLSEIMQANSSSRESFILIIESKNKNYYALTGGSGYHKIAEHVESEFGLSLLSRLVDSKSAAVVLSTETASPINNAYLNNSQYKVSQSLFESEDITSLFKRIKSVFKSSELNAYFPFELKSETVIFCQDSFRLNRSIKVIDVPQMIEGCEKIEADKDRTELSFLQRLNKKNAKKEIQLYNREIGKALRDLSRGINQNRITFSPPDYQKFSSASAYLLKELIDVELNGTDDLNNILEALKSELGYSLNTIKDCIEAFENMKIYAYDDDEEVIASHKLFNCLLFEGKVNGVGAFYIHDTWFKIRGSYLEKIEEACVSFVESNMTKTLSLKKWVRNGVNSENEGPYNEKHLQDKDTLVCDRILPDNIEPCDIIKWDNNNIYLIHVKLGFDASTRDLSSQIINAANHIRIDSKNNREYLTDLYNRMCKPTTEQYRIDLANKMKQIPLSKFLGLFDKNIHFVLAFCDEKNRKIEKDISKFNSNIAKMSLYNLHRSMRSIGMPLMITQIDAV